MAHLHTKEKPKLLTEEEREEYNSILRDLKEENYQVHKPNTREECCNVPRPCPYVSCKYNTYLDVEGKTLRLNYGYTDVWDVPKEYSCVLDIVENNPNGISNEVIGSILGVSRETIRLLEKSTKLFLRDTLLKGELSGDSFTIKDKITEYAESRKTILG